MTSLRRLRIRHHRDAVSALSAKWTSTPGRKKRGWWVVFAEEGRFVFRLFHPNPHQLDERCAEVFQDSGCKGCWRPRLGGHGYRAFWSLGVSGRSSDSAPTPFWWRAGLWTAPQASSGQRPLASRLPGFATVVPPEAKRGAPSWKH